MKHLKRVCTVLSLLLVLWFVASTVELVTGQRVLPWNAYGMCGTSVPASLPKTMQVGLYEEFPTQGRLSHLRYIDFPVTLAVAATSRDDFLSLRSEILPQYRQVREVYFWPLLAHEEGYYPGPWSNAAAVERVASEATDIPVLWDMEAPLNQAPHSLSDWVSNRTFFSGWLSARTAPVHIWRTHTSMGLDPVYLRLAGIQFDPADYPAVSMHLDLYTKSSDMPADQLSRILRCGVERYGERFIPSFGVLDDGEGPPTAFVSQQSLRRNLLLARAAGVSQVWLFGLNGMNESLVKMVKETIPLER